MAARSTTIASRGLQLTSTNDVAKKLNMIMCARFNLSLANFPPSLYFIDFPPIFWIYLKCVCSKCEVGTLKIKRFSLKMMSAYGFWSQRLCAQN